MKIAVTSASGKLRNKINQVYNTNLIYKPGSISEYALNINEALGDFFVNDNAGIY